MEETTGKDFMASELLRELKEENQRKDRRLGSLHKVLTGVIAGAFTVILIIIGGFLWYLNQYDFEGTSTSYNTATGVYAVVDSHGNVITGDLTAEEIDKMLEALSIYGYSETTTDQNTPED